MLATHSCKYIHINLLGTNIARAICLVRTYLPPRGRESAAVSATIRAGHWHSMYGQ